MQKSFPFRNFEETESKFKLSLDWDNNKLSYDFRIERKGSVFPDDIEDTFLHPIMHRLQLTWRLQLIPVATLGLTQFRQILDEEGNSLAFEACGALECPVDIVALITDWSTIGPEYFGFPGSRDYLGLSLPEPVTD